MAEKKIEIYKRLSREFVSLVGDERDMIANSANLVALLYNNLENVNWAGFYYLRGIELVLGPFQGKPACVRIKTSNIAEGALGVCATAAIRKIPIVVDDVHAFAGHIACDPVSQSEIVVPICEPSYNKLVGVLDLDSPDKARFDSDDRAGLEAIIKAFVGRTDLT